MIFIFVLILTGCCDLAESREIPDCIVPIKGPLLHHGGDDPGWASPESDDSAWQHFQPSGSRLRKGIDIPAGISWWRIRFTSGQSLTDPYPAVMLERAGNAHEIYLNGVRIGGKGIIGPCFAEAHAGSWVYPLPGHLLQDPGENLLALRILNTDTSGPFFIPPPCIGNYHALHAKALAHNYFQNNIEISLITFLSVFFLVSFFICVNGLRDGEYIAFTVLVFVYLLLYIVDSGFFFNAGLKTPWIQRIYFGLIMCMPAAALWFLFRVNRIPLHLPAMGLTGVSLCLGLMLCLAGTYRMYALVLPWCITVFFCTTVMGLFISVKSWLNKRPESGPVLAGIGCLGAAVAADSAGILNPDIYKPFQGYDFGFGIFFMSIAYALMKRYTRTYKGYQRLSGKILKAHEEERKRLSRDIHDGVGQSLLGVKLRLQMMPAPGKSRGKENADIEAEHISGIINEISNCSEELRNMAMDLQPAFSNQRTLFELLEWYGEKFFSNTGIRVQMKGESLTDVPESSKDNIYRIYQEALGNIAKHAACTRADVFIRIKDNRLTLEIRDNGQGFNPLAHDVFGKGIGLMSMKERTVLLGGVFSIQSRPGKGCTVKIEVPV